MGHHLPELVSGSDGPAGEQGYPRETQVLVCGEHPHGQQVGLTQVVDETANVAKEPGIDAVDVPHLHEEMTQLRLGNTITDYSSTIPLFRRSFFLCLHEVCHFTTVGSKSEGIPATSCQLMG